MNHNVRTNKIIERKPEGEKVPLPLAPRRLQSNTYSPGLGFRWTFALMRDIFPCWILYEPAACTITPLDVFTPGRWCCRRSPKTLCRFRFTFQMQNMWILFLFCIFCLWLIKKRKIIKLEKNVFLKVKIVPMHKKAKKPGLSFMFRHWLRNLLQSIYVCKRKETFANDLLLDMFENDINLPLVLFHKI